MNKEDVEFFSPEEFLDGGSNPDEECIVNLNVTLEQLSDKKFRDQLIDEIEKNPNKRYTFNILQHEKPKKNDTLELQDKIKTIIFESNVNKIIIMKALIYLLFEYIDMECECYHKSISIFNEDDRDNDFFHDKCWALSHILMNESFK